MQILLFLNIDDLQVTVYSGGKHYQKIIGFGGAFTDATGLNMKKHDESLQQIIIEYFEIANSITVCIMQI